MFSESDAKRLFQIAVGARPAWCVETANNSGLASEERVRSEIVDLLDGCPTRITTFTIAKELLIEVRDAIRLLPPGTQFGGEWGRLGESVLIGPTEFRRLKELLRLELGRGVVTLQEFVQKNEIDSELFLKLLSSTQDGDWTWLDAEQTKVCSEAYRKEVKESITLYLNRHVESCTELSAISNAPISFSRRVAVDLLKAGTVKGFIEGNKLMTELFHERLQESVRDKLYSEGIVAVSTLREGHVINPRQWVKALDPEAQLLADHFVSPQMIETIRETVSKKVGWLQVSEIKDPDRRMTAEDTNVLWPMLLESLPDLVVVDGFVVAKGLNAELLRMSRVVATSQAETDWRRDVESDVIAIARALFQYFAEKASLHPTVQSAFTKSLAPSCHAEYQGLLAERQKLNADAEMAAFHDKFITRYHIYRAGVDGLEQSVLKKELILYLLRWVRTNGSKALEKVEAAMKDSSVDLQMLRTVLQKTDVARPQDLLAEISLVLRRLEPNGMEDIISSKRRAMLVDIHGDLQSFKLPSLALLSALILLHATRSTGILKVTGQHVPKLIHEAYNVGLLSDAQLETIKKAKTTIIAGTRMSPEDRENLQAIGRQSLGALGLL